MLAAPRSRLRTPALQEAHLLPLSSPYHQAQDKGEMREVSGVHNLRGALNLGSHSHGAENGCLLNTCTLSASLSHLQAGPASLSMLPAFYHHKLAGCFLASYKCYPNVDAFLYPASSTRQEAVLYTVGLHIDCAEAMWDETTRHTSFCSYWTSELCPIFKN